MMVQAQEEMGEGLANPTDPHHTTHYYSEETNNRKQKEKDPLRFIDPVSYKLIADEAANEENVPTHSNDPLLSGEDRLKLTKLMTLCTNLQNRGRYDDAQMFDTDVFNGEEVFVAKKSEKVVEEVVSTAEVSTAETITTKEINLAQALAQLRSAKPKVVSKKNWEDERRQDYLLELLEKRKKPLQHYALRNEELAPTSIKEMYMLTYLKHMAGYKQSQLKNKSFVKIQKLFDNSMTRVNMFVDMDTELMKKS
ncbi:hypothetical protein Tco_1114080 [Tanacetum coccineum]|uniref:Uncharacterized protein n=1 Tax=Tanacetum coccineum TaxID=301880 RepID=A0ABQ5IU43_9ASTR